MKRFGTLLIIAVAAMASVYVLSSFPVPAIAEQLVFSSQAAADQADALVTMHVLRVVIAAVMLAIIIAVIAMAVTGWRRRAASLRAIFDYLGADRLPPNPRPPG